MFVNVMERSEIVDDVEKEDIEGGTRESFN